jgi:hypothetical protein
MNEALNQLPLPGVSHIFLGAVTYVLPRLNMPMDLDLDSELQKHRQVSIHTWVHPNRTEYRSPRLHFPTRSLQQCAKYSTHFVLPDLNALYSHAPSTAHTLSCLTYTLFTAMRPVQHTLCLQ